MYKNLVAIDVETSGINPFNSELLSIALVPLNIKLSPLNIYIAHNKIEWNSFARENFRKFEKEWNSQAISPTEACEKIEEYLATTFNETNAIGVGHNIGFDMAFLRKLAFQGGRDQIKWLSHRTLDTHTLLYLLSLEKIIPSWAATSDGAFKFFEVAISEKFRHTAIGDAKATRTLFKKLLTTFQHNHLQTKHSANTPFELDHE